jgi:hypothetical protein
VQDLREVADVDLVVVAAQIAVLGDLMRRRGLAQRHRLAARVRAQLAGDAIDLVRVVGGDRR